MNKKKKKIVSADSLAVIHSTAAYMLLRLFAFFFIPRFLFALRHFFFSWILSVVYEWFNCWSQLYLLLMNIWGELIQKIAEICVCVFVQCIYGVVYYVAIGHDHDSREWLASRLVLSIFAASVSGTRSSCTYGMCTFLSHRFLHVEFLFLNASFAMRITNDLAARWSPPSSLAVTRKKKTERKIERERGRER